MMHYAITQMRESERYERCILGELLRAEDEGRISNEAIYGILGDSFNAGIFTTFTTISGFLIALINYPDVQDKLHKEIDRVIGRDMQPALSDREKMPYMEAAILETLRYMSMVPLGIPHKTTRDTKISGCHLPKGTQVWMNLYGMHHDSRYFILDPNVFNPGRFLDSEGNLVSKEERKKVLAFGAGRRVCMGEVLAKVRIFLTLTQLLHKFVFLPDDPERVIPFDMKSFVNTPMALMAPKFKIIAKVR
ncbi:unnamed protein product [Owenia fusiformis]|uniref:Cytochrome P450 n=1 Tax=Owenia fusiformis TaxID=6347 RepID=A0A8S4MU99_OWEFU|nr:unnamed protein product [Owenia fusiformis]